MSGFKITPEDVGRGVMLRSGLHRKIVFIDKESKEFGYPVKLDGGECVTLDGEYDTHIKNHPLDVVSFADENQPRLKDLRDKFAMRAMQSLILTNPTSSSEFSGDIWENPNGRGVHEWMSSTAYAIADAMMKARGVEV